MDFNYGNTNIEFEVTYSKRKTIAILIEAPGKVSVHAPNKMAKKIILDSVKSKAKWIVQRINEIRDFDSNPAEREFIDGESFLYLGKSYPLQLDINEERPKPLVKLYNGKFLITAPIRDTEAIGKAMKVWYRNKCTEQITERIKYYQPIINASPKKVTIKEQKKIWGSCSSKGNLNFNWKAIMAPTDVLDYIIVHEMCHLVHLNHSKDFWNLVASIMPNYKVLNDWLRKNGIRLRL